MYLPQGRLLWNRVLSEPPCELRPEGSGSSTYSSSDSGGTLRGGRTVDHAEREKFCHLAMVDIDVTGALQP